MNVLVAYATRHGATAGIAERIAATLRDHGVDADAVPVEEVSTVEEYDAVVLGGAAYMAHWLKDADRFAKRHESALKQRPVWLFSSGPLGTDEVDEKGRDVREAARPREFAELSELLQPRGEEVFFGAYDPEEKPIGLAERFTRKMPLPAGDFRDWERIDAWARQIARDVASAE
ncbi:flavodoxin domain-containing protein [Isoptericola sp. 178]|uniref:flavodoxin domain-containing protein n=1 Tax=Isoptericola sp. 178 TaxID=3064651 RepID=UPI002713D67E|nr:flavodoxin domain-containing protein [Isoptericola sp. 178]MDO8145175.1 flavodoxin domain-containing protein [Isoptericola sp. 178]